MKTFFFRSLRILFVLLIARPLLRWWFGISASHAERIPTNGPAIVIANHNSHLDILALYCLFPLRKIPQVQPAAAADYFLKNRWLGWFATRVVGIIPVARGGIAQGIDPLEGCRNALLDGQILVLFPEGTRGEPEQLSEIKSGLWFLTADFTDIPIIPVYLNGLGRAMGRGQWLPIPFFIDILVGETLPRLSDKEAFRGSIREAFLALKSKAWPRAD